MNRPTMIETLPAPLDCCRVEWYYKHSQAFLSGNIWRCALVWKEGPFGTCIDGNDSVHLRLAIEAIANYEFPDGKPRKQGVEEKAHFLQMLADRGLTCS